MKNHKTRITLLLCVLLFVGNQKSFTQESEHSGSKVGIGVNLFNVTEFEYYYFYTAFGTIYVPIDIGNKFRLEPSFGIATLTGYEEYCLAFGVFGKKNYSKFDLLFGSRFGYNSNEYILVGPAIGGEYYFVKNFSLGAEAQALGLINGGLEIITNTNIFVRFYF